MPSRIPLDDVKRYAWDGAAYRTGRKFSRGLRKPSTKPSTKSSSSVQSRAERIRRQLEGDTLEATRRLQTGAPQSTEQDTSSYLSSTPSRTQTQRRRPTAESGEEKRLRRFRPKPPQSFLVKLERARTQRMIVLGRKRGTDADGVPYQEIDIVGSTGNVYQVTISRVPRCTCPDSGKGNECKHKVYALHTVLKAPEHLQYQLALLSSELHEIFANAPPIPTDVPTDKDGDADGKRKPTDGECPICYMDLDEEHNRLVWCKAQCGHNMHKSCFDQWLASQEGRQVRCVYCRTPWELDIGDIAAVKAAGEQTAEGYINVADQFGLSRARDYSGYYQPWARQFEPYSFSPYPW
ncbi:hypothetical protein ABEF95_000659 [Exophiala dermatitidis]|uniref:Uncharacterized protein n=1 Tax=Exophiala dermatitidis (strain ATCC 34100 / CBS 525.76 / NIH/UT8656) TaxID=858893 RepID=H6BKZ0_EXODN|nr:uncharacterized protein HMPREF1120_00018 [Exophiala dermatitidis NIH/UT8656]EHY51791.1 hypothetical protein HMPREF1120_00018 [Exophiala dermatitidis NIH/UT8656]